MGIDVRAYAMANQDVKRAACVGCGMCAGVCPRGVLKLELKPDRFKSGTPIRVYAVDLQVAAEPWNAALARSRWRRARSLSFERGLQQPSTSTRNSGWKGSAVKYLSEDVVFRV